MVYSTYSNGDWIFLPPGMRGWNGRICRYSKEQWFPWTFSCWRTPPSPKPSSQHAFSGHHTRGGPSAVVIRPPLLCARNSPFGLHLHPLLLCTLYACKCSIWGLRAGVVRIMLRPYHSVTLWLHNQFGAPFCRSYWPILTKFGKWARLPSNRKEPVPFLTHPLPPKK